MCEVYKITNLKNGKLYIGITNQGARVRFLHHLYEARSGSLFPIHKAIRKYGEENFEQEVIETCLNYQILKIRERYWIKILKSKERNTGYNLTIGGDGTFGRKLSEETKEKIRLKAIGRKRSKESIERGRQKLLGIIPNNNCAETLRQYNLSRGKHVTRINRISNEETIYDSYCDAARNNNTTDNTIKRMILHPKDTDVFLWRYTI